MNAFEVRDYVEEQGYAHFTDDLGYKITINLDEGFILYGSAIIIFEELIVRDWDEIQFTNGDNDCAFIDCKNWKVIE